MSGQGSGTRLKMIAAGAGAIVLVWGVCRAADWVVYSDEERIVDRITAAAEAVKARNWNRLRDFVRLSEFGFTATGWGERRDFGAGAEDALVERAKQAASSVEIGTLEVSPGEDDVRIEGPRAQIKVTLVFEDGGGRYRQPARIAFRKSGEEWFVTEFEILSSEQLFRL